MKKTGRSRRFLAIALSALIMGSTALTAGAKNVADFKDVSDKAWYYDAVKYVADKGILNGMSETEYGPQTVLTRAMFVQTMANYSENYDSDLEIDVDFNDTKEKDWFYHAANWASNNMLISGTAEKTLSPQNNITREQAATILYSYAMRTGGVTTVKDFNGISHAGYNDADKVSDWAQLPMCWALDHGIMTGVDAKTMDPKGNLTRAQAAQLFQNIMINKVLDEKPNVYEFNIREDFDIDFLRGLDYTHEELIENFGEFEEIFNLDENDNPIEDKEYRFFIYGDTTEAIFIYKVEDIDTTTKLPKSSALPYTIETDLKNVAPDFVGKTFGEIIKLTEGDIDIYMDGNYLKDSKIVFRGEMLTKSHLYSIIFRTSEDGGIGPVKEDSIVNVWISPIRDKTQNPDNTDAQ